MHSRAAWDRLLLEARAGDPRAIGRLLAAASGDLREVVAGVVRRSSRARLSVEEVFSHAVLAALRGIEQLRASNYVGFRYWFASIARNHVRCELRERGRPRLLAQAELTAAAARGAHGIEVEGHGALHGALRRLPDRQQVAFVLREGFALGWHSLGFVLAQRGAPAARLIHYRAVVHMQTSCDPCPPPDGGAPSPAHTPQG